MKTILAFSGSSRLNSLNAKLLEKAEAMAEATGAVVETIDLRALNLPIYDGDFEAANGLPPAVIDLKEALREADGFLIACPEYNSFPTPLLLNAIDWASRAGGGDPKALSVFQGKAAGLIAASPSPLGGLRALWMLRSLLQNIGVVVAPSLAAVGGATLELLDDEHFANSAHGRRVQAVIDELLRLSAS
jgi:NAD(P)H-dependent FMN reductase